MKIYLFAAVGGLLLSGCYSQVQVASYWLKKNANRASGKCSSEGYLKVGNPYKIQGVTYKPVKSSYGYDEVGVASWYGSDFHAKATANGECYDMYAMTAAHKTLPLPTTVRVTNLKNGRSVVLKVNDRGPYAKGRIIDLSYAAAKQLGMARDGVSKVRVQAIGGPHHTPNGASQSTILASRQGNTSTSKQSTSTPSSYKLSDKLLSSVSAGVTKVKTVTIGGVNVNAHINESVSLKDVKNAMPTKAQPQPSFTERVSAQTLDDTAAQHIESVAPSAGTSNALSIQLGSYNQHANAVAKWEAVSQQFPETKLVTTNINGTATHRVRIGPFKNQADASSVLEKARAAGFNNAVLVIE